VAREGERYRLSLERLAEERGVKDYVIFYNRFVSLEDLASSLARRTFTSRRTSTKPRLPRAPSPTSSARARPWCPRPYWHAQELLAEDRGSRALPGSPAIAEGVCGFLDDPERHGKRPPRGLSTRARDDLARRGRAVTSNPSSTPARIAAPRHAPPSPGWTLASRPYDLPPLRLDHIVRMSDGTGIFQHAHFNVPDFHEGYCTDDNARAFILCNLLDELGGKPPGQDLDRPRHELPRLPLRRGEPRNGALPELHEPRSAVAGRSGQRGQPRSGPLGAWAIGAGRSRNEGHRRLSAQLFERGLPVVETFISPRAWAFHAAGHSRIPAGLPRQRAAKSTCGTS
jgi:hypothetical protein